MTDQQKKIAAGAGFAVLAGLILFYELHDSSGPAAPPPPAVTTTTSGGRGAVGAEAAAKHLGTTAAELDPALHFGGMPAAESLQYAGSGRNIFSAVSAAPVEIPKPVSSARVEVPPPVIPAGPVGPPPPPPIDLKFFGTATTTAKGRQAFLLKGDDVFLASAGDIVQRRYKVGSIASSSCVVEDLADNHRQTLPLLVSF